ncbi:hypothetical protein [Streptomyces sp. HC307]|uniref:hypothetical protein n=1 Tax=Streptomyces flavusporus TaxID=3385496 RepID=UPI00391740B9
MRRVRLRLYLQLRRHARQHRRHDEVDTGNDCVQTYATRVKQGEWHLYDDVREAAPTWTEVCGRSAMSGWINSTSMGGAFSSGFSTKYRMLDKDPCWVDFPSSRTAMRPR